MSGLAGLDYLSSIVQSGDTAAFLKHSVSPELFNEAEMPLFEKVKTHVTSHGQLPAISTFKGMGSFMGFGASELPEPPSYYLDLLERRYLHNEMSGSIQHAADLLKTSKQSDALQVLQDTVLALSIRSQKMHVADFRDAQELLQAHYIQALKGGPEGVIKTGWDTFDDMSGGLMPADILSLIARPGAGKTFVLAWLAHQAHQMGYSPLFVSMEMNPELIMQRLIAIHAKGNASHIKTGLMGTYEYANISETLVGLKNAPPFWIVDGNLSATVEDVYSMAVQWKPDLVVVDGAYLLKPYARSGGLDHHRRVAESIEGIKMSIATDLQLPTMLSFQFNRSSTNLKKSEELGLQHIAGSDAIGQISSVVLGLMQEDSVETLNQKKISILKGRSGEMGEFDINWNFTTTDFSEIQPTTLEDLQFL